MTMSRRSMSNIGRVPTTIVNTKIRLRLGGLVMLGGTPNIPRHISRRKKERLKRAYQCADLYYRRGFTQREIASFLKVSDRMVRKILWLATDNLFRLGRICMPADLANSLVKQAVARRAQKKSAQVVVQRQVRF